MLKARLFLGTLNIINPYFFTDFSSGFILVRMKKK